MIHKVRGAADCLFGVLLVVSAVVIGYGAMAVVLTNAAYQSASLP